MQPESLQGDSIQVSKGPFRAKLLLINDDSDELLYYGQVLQRAGFDVRCIRSFSEGAALMGREPFDLIVTSPRGPEFAGWSVLARFADPQRETPVLVLGRSPDSARRLEVRSLNGQREGVVQLSEIASLAASCLSSGEPARN
jgi:response regulator RpfG family c-di-GMP phosphodiesterase